MREHIPSVIIRRLPKYYRHLTALRDCGVTHISSRALGKEMNITASQVRQDFRLFGEFGLKGYGYIVEDLRAEIGHILGVNRSSNQHMVIIGAGNLGRALLQNFRFSDAGFSMDAAFDISSTVIGTTINDVPVYSTNMIDTYFHQHQVDVVALTIPQSIAQETVNHLVDLVVRFFWNFTNIELSSAHPDVIFENIHFADSLLRLSYQISHF